MTYNKDMQGVDSVSEPSIGVTMKCAGYPSEPSPPTLIIGNRDLIQVSWWLPDTDGGSPVTGFLVWMKTALEGEYVLVDAVGEEDPTYLVYQNTTDHNGLPISPNDYEIAVSALNWVGEGEKSAPLTFTVPYLVS